MSIKSVQDLIRAERLNDIAKLLTPRELDEVPLASRLSRLQFLSGLDVVRQSKTLLAGALEHLEQVFRYRDREEPATLVMLSLSDWSDLKAPTPTPIIPNFWICSRTERDLGSFSLIEPRTNQAKMVTQWLADMGQTNAFEALDAAVDVEDEDLLRVYVAQRDDVRVKAFRR